MVLYFHVNHLPVYILGITNRGPTGQGLLLPHVFASCLCYLVAWPSGRNMRWRVIRIVLYEAR